MDAIFTDDRVEATEVLGWEDGDIEGITTRQFWGETVWKCKNAPIYNTHYRQTYGAVVIQFCFTAADWRATGVCAGIMIGTTESGGRRANFKEQLEKMLLIRGWVGVRVEKSQH